MSTNTHLPHNQKTWFQQMVMGVLLYSVVLGFFNDYTAILHTGTYSTTFLLAVVLQLLTMLTLWCKTITVRKITSLQLQKWRIAVALSVWAIMFLSKFVFLAVIAIIFRGSVIISGFVGLMVIIVVMLVMDYIIQFVDKKLQA